MNTKKYLELRNLFELEESEKIVTEKIVTEKIVTENNITEYDVFSFEDILEIYEEEIQELDQPITEEDSANYILECLKEEKNLQAYQIDEGDLWLVCEDI